MGKRRGWRWLGGWRRGRCPWLVRRQRRRRNIWGWNETRIVTKLSTLHFLLVLVFPRLCSVSVEAYRVSLHLRVPCSTSRMGKHPKSMPTSIRIKSISLVYKTRCLAWVSMVVRSLWLLLLLHGPVHGQRHARRRYQRLRRVRSLRGGGLLRRGRGWRWLWRRRVAFAFLLLKVDVCHKNYRGGLNYHSQVVRMLHASWGRTGKQQ